MELSAANAESYLILDLAADKTPQPKLSFVGLGSSIVRQVDVSTMFGSFRIRGARADDIQRASEILNAGLVLAMEWGEHWGDSIQARLATQFPDLQSGTLDRFDKRCRAAMEAGHALVWDMWHVGIENINYDEWQGRMKTMHPWIVDSNLSRLFSQGVYYAWKG